VSHIIREENAPTDFMTVRVSKGIATEYIMSNLSSKLNNLINLDGTRCGFERKPY